MNEMGGGRSMERWLHQGEGKRKLLRLGRRLQPVPGGLPTDLVNVLSWDTVTLVPLRIVCGCFHAIRTEVSSCNRDGMAHKPKVFIVWSFTDGVRFYPKLSRKAGWPGLIRCR